MYRDIMFSWNGGASKRYHTVQTLKIQDIAAHSFGVAWGCELITEGYATKNLIMAALEHDLAEHVVGDIPSPAKRALGVKEQFDKYEQDTLVCANYGMYIDTLAYDEKIILKLADNIDGLLFCLNERRLGNRNVEIVYERFKSYCNEPLAKLKESHSLYAANAYSIIERIHDEWLGVTNGR